MMNYTGPEAGLAKSNTPREGFRCERYIGGEGSPVYNLG